MSDEENTKQSKSEKCDISYSFRYDNGKYEIWGFSNTELTFKKIQSIDNCESDCEEISIKLALGSKI